jgi:TPR repeat protein
VALAAGAGTEVNTTQAAELFEQAMRGDVGPAYNALGTMHFNGQARAHLQIAALVVLFWQSVRGCFCKAA